jgi:iron complex outermembrane receptor protein
VGALRLAHLGRRYSLTSLTARRSFEADHSRFDLDFSPQNLLVLVDDHDHAAWSQELRLASADPEAPWRWQLGGFFEDTVAEPDLRVQANDTGLVQAPPPLGFGLPFTAPVSDEQRARIHGRTFAAFGEVATTVLAPVELSAGLRYQHDDAEMRRRHLLDAPADGVRVPVAPPLDLTTSSSAWLPQLTAAYRFRSVGLAYATVARGYRAAGLSHLVDDPAAARFEPQRHWSWETGLKTAWLEDRITADLALFYILARDFQVIRRAGFTSFQVLNADQVTSRGVEAALTARPWAGVALEGAVGYTDARYDDFRTPEGVRLDGNAIQFVPPYTFALALEYRHPRGALARVDWHGLGAFDFTEVNDGGQDAYELLDARVGWRGRRFGAFVFGRNLTDATYFPFGLAGGPGGDFIVAPGAPRTFGMLVTASF